MGLLKFEDVASIKFLQFDGFVLNGIENLLKGRNGYEDMTLKRFLDGSRTRN